MTTNLSTNWQLYYVNSTVDTAFCVRQWRLPCHFAAAVAAHKGRVLVQCGRRSRRGGNERRGHGGSSALVDLGVDSRCSAIRAARCCRSTTRCSSIRRSSTCWSATNRARPICRGGLCAVDRQARRRAGHVRPRRDQCRHRHHRRADGFDPDGRPDRPGVRPPLIGTDAFQECGHGRHHAPLHQA